MIAPKRTFLGLLGKIIIVASALVAFLFGMFGTIYLSLRSPEVQVPNLVGQARALGLALTGVPLMADKAAEWGMIWKCVDDDALDGEVDALAAKLAALPPLGLAAIKSIIRTSGSRTLDEELDLQRDEMRRLGFTADYREGVAAFLEKRTPSFTGR